MSTSKRIALAVLSLAAVSALVAGCTPEEQAAFDKWCLARPQMCQEIKQFMGVIDAEETEVKAETVAMADLPAPLQRWSRERAEEASAATFTAGEQTYVGVAAGMQRSGGYRLELTRVVSRSGDMVVEARLVAPPPGAMVTMALTNPVGYFKLPKASGAVSVRLTAGDGAKPLALEVQKLEASAARLTVEHRWVTPMLLQVSGTADVADLHFELLAGGELVSQADAQVKAGEYIGNMTVEAGPTGELTLVVSTVEPGGGRELTRVTVPPAPSDGGVKHQP